MKAFAGRGAHHGFIGRQGGNTGQRLVALNGVLNTIARLTEGVMLDPVLPAGGLPFEGHRGILIEGVTLLKTSFAFVHRLKAGPATGKQSDRRNGEADGALLGRMNGEAHGLATYQRRCPVSQGRCPTVATPGGGLSLDAPGESTTKEHGFPMFTGLIEDQGRVERRSAHGTGARVTIRCEGTGPYARALRDGDDPFAIGESIAIDGVCLTVIAFGPHGFDADISRETLSRTTLGELPLGHVVNLERALKASSRLGGHLVSGHVDGRGTVAHRTPDGDAVRFGFRVPEALLPLVAEKGSVAVSGVSLTVNAVSADGFEVTIIPHTLEKTSLGTLAVGAPVNLEVDIVARYVARLAGFTARGASVQQAAEPKDAEWLARLTRAGYV